MNRTKQSKSIIAAVSGVAIATVVIIATNKNDDISSDVYKVNIEEMRELQSQLSEARIELEELKIDVLTAGTIIHPKGRNIETEAAQDSSAETSDEGITQNNLTTEENHVPTEAMAEPQEQQEEMATSNWSRIGEEEITAAFHEINPLDSHLMSTMCESDTCQVEISHNDKEAELQFLASVSNSDLIFGYEGYFRNIENEDGSSKSVFHFSRDPQSSVQ